MEKKVFLALILLNSLSSFACPDLSGTYKNADGDLHDIFMDQVNGVTTFQWGDKAKSIKIDGKNATCNEKSITLFMKSRRGTIIAVVTKTADGYKYTSNDPANPGDEFTKQY